MTQFFVLLYQDTIKNQVSPKTSEGQIKTPTKARKFYHDVDAKPRNIARKLFDGPEDESQKSQEDKKEHLDKGQSLPSSPIDNMTALSMVNDAKYSTNPTAPLSLASPKVFNQPTTLKISSAPTKSSISIQLTKSTALSPFAVPDRSTQSVTTFSVLEGGGQPTTSLAVPVFPDSVGLGQPTSALAQDGDLEKIKLLAQQGNIDNQYKLARIYREKAKETGDQQAQAINNAEAVKWYIKAAEQEHVLAQYYLGFMYESGLGVKQSNTDAIKWYTKAANQGDKPAQQQLQKLNGKSLL